MKNSYQALHKPLVCNFSPACFSVKYRKWRVVSGGDTGRTAAGAGRWWRGGSCWCPTPPRTAAVSWITASRTSAAYSGGTFAPSASEQRLNRADRFRQRWTRTRTFTFTFTEAIQRSTAATSPAVKFGTNAAVNEDERSLKCWVGRSCRSVQRRLKWQILKWSSVCEFEPFQSSASSEQVAWTVFPVCADTFREVKRVLFVPYALHDRDKYTQAVRAKFSTLGTSPGALTVKYLGRHLSCGEAMGNLCSLCCVGLQVTRWTASTKPRTPLPPSGRLRASS